LAGQVPARVGAGGRRTIAGRAEAPPGMSIGAASPYSGRSNDKRKEKP
jgi:hypothetical protein